ncbi:flagellar biosynthetic protein FliR [Halomonas binhaiensis]|uniref:Flagellar biosynthetic protein FliR n=1 Tax=Halomonas binhaiensis TaxID=2562282 RepID=A0A5C1NLV0_9GAMM|nr:flagellar biosynthetic protein FliR [Halomonas binhaiensis]QEM84244.1 flagellar biosynthetic protein FliR [Halomonas binhaiensis]
MIELTSNQLQDWLVIFLWPFFRISSLMLSAPLWGHGAIPTQVKVALAAAISMMIAPLIPPMPAIPISSWSGFGLIVEQIIIGVTIGMTVRVMLGMVQASGEFIGLQMGLAFATFFDPSIGTNMTVVSRYLYMFMLLIFLSLNGHLIVLETLVNSFITLPIGIQHFNPEAFILVVRYSASIFATGLLLALPLVASLLVINLALGILNRAAPQLTVFNIGFPTTLTVGLVLLIALMKELGPFLERHVHQGLSYLHLILDSMAPLTQ